MRKIAVEKLAPVLSPKANIAAAWLFGSAEDGHLRQAADLDIGVLFETRPGLDELADLRADLQEAVGFEDIDLVVLNDASAILRFQAASGRRLYARDDGQVAEFVSLAAREYEDETAMTQRHLVPVRR